MHVAMVANTAWLDEELNLFKYLVVGLIDEQVRVVQVVPDSLSIEESSAFGEKLTWQDSPWPFVRRWRLGALHKPLSQLDVTVIHALDGRLWDAALRLSGRLDVPTVLTAASTYDLAQAQRLRQAALSPSVAFAATTEPLQRALAERLGPDALVEVVPLGVHLVEPTAPDEPDKDRSLGAVVTGTGEFDDDYDALLRAMRAVINDHPQTQFFFDVQSGQQRTLWQAAGRLGLLSNMSLVPRRLGHRELLLNADALIQPQAQGRSRGLTLQAMVRGLPVIARSDPWLDYLLDDQTAWVVDRPDPAKWETLLRRIIDNPRDRLALGRRARDHVAQHHSAARHVARTLALYRQVTGEGIKFDAQEPA